MCIESILIDFTNPLFLKSIYFYLFEYIMYLIGDVLNTHKDWYTAEELKELETLPSSASSISRKARLEGWDKRQIKGTKGVAYEYNIRSLPEKAKAELNYSRSSTDKRDMVVNRVPYHDVYASAGFGVIPLEESAEYTIDIHPQILLNQGISPNGLFAMPVKGDSMEPSIYEGDIILVKKTSSSVGVLEGVYVIRIYDQIFVKRIQFNRFQGYLQVDSDNAFYRSYTIEGEDLNSVEILGEAVFVMGRVRRVKAPASQPASQPASKG